MNKIYAQHVVDDNYFLDSIQKQIHLATSDTAKANLYLQLSYHWSDKDTLKAFSYLKKAEQLGGNNSFYKALLHFYKGAIYFGYDIKKSQQEYMNVEKLLQKYSSPLAYQYRSRAWHDYGVLEQQKDNSKAFVEILLTKAIPYATQANDSIRIAVDFMDIGSVFMNNDEFASALMYYDKALQILRNTSGKYAELADCYTNAAKALVLDKQYKKSKPYLDSSFHILSINPKSEYLPAYYCVSGMYYRLIQKNNIALSELNKGLQLAKELNVPYDELSILYQQYHVYKEQKKFAKAKKVLLEVYDMDKRMQLSNNTKFILFELAETNSSLGNTSAAYKWLMQYSKLSDSIFETKNKTEIAALEAKYQSEKKEKQILSLENVSKKQQSDIEHKQFINYILLSGIIILLLLLLMLYIIYNNKQRNIKMMEQANMQKIKEMEQQQQLQIYNAMLQGQEAERKRLAQDLHDGLGGMLAGVKIGLSDIAENSNQKPRDMELYKVINQLDYSVDELRRIARNLMPETLLRFGLKPALKDLCDSIENNKTEVVFQAYNMSDKIDQQHQVVIYRIIQELVANAVKYAEAKKVLVQCIQEKNMLHITVEDNGKGFDITVQKDKSMGLTSVENRVNYMQGKMEIQSNSKDGTTINIEVNVQQ